MSVEQQVVWPLDNLEKIGGHRVTVEGDPKVIDTPNGKAIAFDGVDDGIFLDVHPMAGWPTFTAEVVFQPYKGGLPEQRFFHMQENDTEDRVLFETRLTGDDRWFLDTFVLVVGSGCTLFAEEHPHSVGPWYHAAAVVDGTTMKHYVNGQLELSREMTYSPQKHGKTSLGVRLNRVCWYKGAIRTVRFTSGVLAPDTFLTADD